MTAFAPLLGLLEEVPDHRRAEGKVYRLAHVLLFSILAIVSGGNSYRSIATFIEMHRHRLNEVFGLTWRRAPAHTAIRYILQGLDSDAVEAAFRRHASLLQAAHAKPGGGSLAIDGKTLRGSFDGFRDRAAAHLLAQAKFGPPRVAPAAQRLRVERHRVLATAHQADASVPLVHADSMLPG